jgi:hypothetical protein
VWCVPHQIDLVVKAVTTQANRGVFYRTSHAWSVHLRKQYSLITEMGSKCPKDTTRWVQFGKMLGWMLKHRRRLTTYVEQRQPEQAPSASWWVMAAGVQPILNTVNVTLVLLQNKLLVLSQQHAEVERLIVNVCAMLDIRLVEVNSLCHKLDQVKYCRSDRWWVSIDDIRDHVSDQGSGIVSIFHSLADDTQQAILSGVGTFGVHLIEGLVNLQAERDEYNRGAGSESVSVMPTELALMRPATFVLSVIVLHRDMMMQYWTEDEVEEIESEQRELYHAYAYESSGVKAICARHTMMTTFNQAWDDFPRRFRQLRQFVGGLATIFANTTSVESDFSILKWTKTSDRSALSHLSVEGTFQAKQRELLLQLSLAHHE